VRRAIFFCWSGCLLALFFAPGAWAQAEPCPVVVLSPSSQLQLSESSTLASTLSTAQKVLHTATALDKAEVIATQHFPEPVSPYQRWRQRYAPSDPFSSGLNNVPYRPAQQGSQRIQQGTERLPFWLEQSGIRLGEDSPFFLHPSGLVYRQSY
jgi:hypothetical protein